MDIKIVVEETFAMAEKSWSPQKSPLFFRSAVFIRGYQTIFRLGSHDVHNWNSVQVQFDLRVVVDKLVAQEAPVRWKGYSGDFIVD
jgi:hypothetical protein